MKNKLQTLAKTIRNNFHLFKIWENQFIISRWYIEEYTSGDSVSVCWLEFC